ncbi:MAG: DUF3850 domain-containing protein [Candidatus Diapherotrites archaeon]|nr:DUF3850 domain-containing protein [Candidatus Diapherotrites archaeon]
MQIIEKKCWPEYFEKILRGEKKFELRLADFKIEVGDTLFLREWNPKTKEYTGREIQKVANYITKSKDWKVYTQEEIEKYGFYVIGLKD